MGDSLWKKEISFSRKPKAEKAPEAPKASAAEQPKESFLKKEISFSRKPKAEKAPKAPKASAAQQPKTSFLKKEISFSRKKRDREIDRLVGEAEQSVSPAFRLAFPGEVAPTALAEAAVAAMAQAPAEQEPPAVEPAPVPVASFEPVVPAAPGLPATEPTFVEQAQVPAAPLAAAVEPAPVELQLVDSLPTELHPAVLSGAPHPSASSDDGYAVPVLPLAEPPVAAVPAPAPETLADVVVEAPTPLAPPPTMPAPAASVPEPAEPWLAAPVLPPTPEVPPAVVIHPPVAAAELPPIADAGPKTPFWKKELSLSRAAKAPKPPKAQRARKPAAASSPFWKRELSFRRTPGEQDAEPVAEAPTVVLPAADRVPFWKKKVSFSKPSFSLPSRGSKGGHGAKKLVGLKIGASQLAAARISNNGSAELQQIAREPLAAGIVVGGELRDPGALGDALKVFFTKNKLPRKGVRLGIASNRIGVRIFDIVGVEQDRQLANAVQFRAQETLPIPLDEAVLDYQVLGESVDAEGQTVKRVLLVVAYRELVDRYVSACRQAGITLAGIDLEAFAMLRALAAPTDRGDAACVAVAIGHDRSTFAVSDGRVCEFTRVLEWGGSSLNVALARVFDSTPSEVEAIKRSLSLDGGEPPPGLTEAQAAQALDAVRRQVQSFARELVSSLQFYQNQPGSRGIGEILLTGGTAGLAGLAPELERLIGVHVRVGDPLVRLKVPKRLDNPEQLGSYAVAIGLAIED
ncbi:MAG TPA: type IV pilus assembly protein PilM [Gaiellaceae bacterium]|nr:type IV pilus assembly protein PilM [Gaiellaceae bacterium]